MPKKMLDDDDIRPRRRGAKAVAIDADNERGLAMRLLLHSPKDMVAGLLAAAAIIAILTNALFLQAGRHPSPMFGGSVVTLPAPDAAVAVSAPILPRPRPVEAAARPVEPATTEALKPAEVKPAEPKLITPRMPDPMTNLVMKSTAPGPVAPPASALRPPAPIPTTSMNAAGRRIAAVQRALTEYGYGQLKPTGMIGADTQAAIAKFERSRKLPVTGQMSDRVVHELSAMIGHSIE